VVYLCKVQTMIGESDGTADVDLSHLLLKHLGLLQDIPGFVCALSSRGLNDGRRVEIGPKLVGLSFSPTSSSTPHITLVMERNEKEPCVLALPQSCSTRPEETEVISGGGSDNAPNTEPILESTIVEVEKTTTGSDLQDEGKL
jgi:hypothetical protein